MKATPVPFHKILGSHTQSQNSYAPGQGFQKKIENYHTGLCMFIHHTSLVNNLGTLFLDFP